MKDSEGEENEKSMDIHRQAHGRDDPGFWGNRHDYRNLFPGGNEIFF